MVKGQCYAWFSDVGICGCFRMRALMIEIVNMPQPIIRIQKIVM